MKRAKTLKLLLIAISLICCGCSKNSLSKDDEVNIKKYLYEASCELVSGRMNQADFCSVSKIYIFKTKSNGVPIHIFPEYLHKYKDFYSSTNEAVIAEFMSLLGKDSLNFSLKTPGETFHVLLKINNTTSAYYFRIFIPNGDDVYAWVVGGTDPQWSVKSSAVYQWVREREKERGQ